VVHPEGDRPDLFSAGEANEALNYAVEAALDPGEEEKKVRLYELLAEIFRSMGMRIRPGSMLLCLCDQAGAGMESPEAMAEMAPAFDFADEDPAKEGYPILLTHVGMKKFITHFENRLNQQVLYLPKAKRLTYRDVCLEQVRLLARALFDEEPINLT